MSAEKQLILLDGYDTLHCYDDNIDMNSENSLLENTINKKARKK